MNLQEERARLLADTIVFLQQATGDSLVLAVKAKVPLTPEIEAAARHLRRYHSEPKPKQIGELRKELHAIFDVFTNMQPALLACQSAGIERAADRHEQRIATTAS